MLKVDRLGHSFGRTRLFENVSLSLALGEVVAIVGPSGVGKSTLLSLLAGFAAPCEGAVSNTFGTPAIVLQSHHALPARTVLENALLFSHLDRDASADSMEMAKTSLDRLGLRQLSDKRARQLSGGELQRVAVARALTSSRRLILADEPTSNLDRRSAAVVMSLLADVASMTVERSALIVTHDYQALPEGVRTLELTGSGLVDADASLRLR